MKKHTKIQEQGNGQVWLLGRVSFQEKTFPIGNPVVKILKPIEYFDTDLIWEIIFLMTVSFYFLPNQTFL